MSRTGRAVALASALACLSISGACLSKEWRGSDAESKAAVTLDTPFRFLLHLEGYRVASFSAESDMFSTWGFLTLRWKQGSTAAGARPSAANLRERLIAAAAKAGWKSVNYETIDVDDRTLDDLGVRDAGKPVELAQSRRGKDRHAPTRYACRAWIAADADKITVGHRVDGN
ncbi:MAG TPA: hypothetical protein VGS03_16515 [Candidatus Polarisedimenticolia bacterium]|jgi:hypothetical protein|nr:hypothetical protein [Candidatus Polarisedimenticolia bacterium]